MFLKKKEAPTQPVGFDYNSILSSVAKRMNTVLIKASSDNINLPTIADSADKLKFRLVSSVSIAYTGNIGPIQKTIDEIREFGALEQFTHMFDSILSFCFNSLLEYHAFVDILFLSLFDGVPTKDHALLRRHLYETLAKHPSLFILRVMEVMGASRNS